MLSALCRAPESDGARARPVRATSAQIASGRGLVNASQFRVLNSTYRPNDPAADEHAADDHRAAQLQHAASHRWFRLGVAARLLECPLDEHDTLALQVDPQLLDVPEALGRVAPGHFDRAGWKRALDELEVVGRRVDAERPLQCVEAQGRSRAARSAAATVASAALPVAKLATCPRGLNRTLKLAGRRRLIATVGIAGVRDADAPLRNCTFADRLACRGEAGHRRDIADVERGLEFDVGARSSVRVSKAGDGVARFRDHRAVWQLQRQVGARPRLVVIGHRCDQRADCHGSEGGVAPRQSAERDDLRAVGSQVALERHINGGALGDAPDRSGGRIRARPSAAAGRLEDRRWSDSEGWDPSRAPSR